MTTLRRILTGAALVVMASGIQQLAKADIITTLVSDFDGGTGTCTQASGTYCYVYQVSLTGAEDIGTSPAWSEFGTLYDISTTAVTPVNLTGLLANTSDFTFTTATSFTAAHSTAPLQTPGYFSLRYTYDAEGTVIDGPDTLGTFEIDSTAPPTGSTGGAYDGQATDTSNGNENGNVGELVVPGVVPVIPSSTPEPTTMALMGGALLGLGLIGKRFKKS